MRHILFVLLVACTGETSTDDDTALLTEADRIAQWEGYGPTASGYREIDVTYDDETTGMPRTLRVGIFYPTTDTSTNAVSFAGPNAPTDVRRDAAPMEGTRPLMLFSHGHQGSIDNCAGLLAHAVSHGWVAATIEHTGNTLADGGERDTEIFVQRPYDVSAALDALEQEPWYDGRVYGVGHSFGGYTMFLSAGGQWDVDHWAPICGAGGDDFCSAWSPELESLMRASAADARIDAFATLSGGNWAQLREQGYSGIDRPLLLVSGALDGSVSNEGNSDPIWRDLAAGDKLRVDLAHGDHQTYTDFAGALPGVLPGTSVDALEAERGYRILRVYLQAFASEHVLGDDEGVAGILDGSVEVDDDVGLSRK